MSDTEATKGNFRKRPVVVQAIQYDPQNPLDVMLRWVPQVNDGVVAEMRTDGDRLIISTLEGDMAAEPGDWIIRGVAGEFYPIKDNIFSETYEAADDATDAAKAFKVGDFTYDYAGRSATECHRQAAMSDEAEAALWEHMATTIKILQGELASVHKCWDEDLADTRRLRVAAAILRKFMEGDAPSGSCVMVENWGALIDSSWVSFDEAGIAFIRALRSEIDAAAALSEEQT